MKRFIGKRRNAPVHCGQLLLRTFAKAFDGLPCDEFFITFYPSAFPLIFRNILLRASAPNGTWSFDGYIRLFCIVLTV